MYHPKEKFPRPGNGEIVQTHPGVEAHMVTKPDYGRESYQGNRRLAGKRALVTGGDSGIGRAVAYAFAQEGADVLISYLPEEEEDARETVLAIESCGQRAIALPGDLQDSAYHEELVHAMITAWGTIDVLVNNAAKQKYFKELSDITEQDFQEIYHINVTAPFLLSQRIVQHMRPGSSIINTVSVQAYDPSSLLLPYAASKSALVALTKALAEELIEDGIRVNAVAPGPIWSPLNTHGSPPTKLQHFGEQSIFGRPGQPVELSPVYVLLASDEASYITGEIYGVTGGKGVI